MLYKVCCVKDNYATTRKTQTHLDTTIRIDRKTHGNGGAIGGTVIPDWLLESG